MGPDEEPKRQSLDESKGGQDKGTAPKRPWGRWLFFTTVIVLLFAAGVGTWMLADRESGGSVSSGQPSINTKQSTATSSTSSPKISIPAAINPVDPTAIPLGTGNVSSVPQSGYVDFCNRRGITTAPEPSLPWINTANNTWNSETKPTVEGSVSWTNAAYYTETVSGNIRTIATNDLPINHDTGIFPISPSDPVYKWDRNPNHILPQATNWQLPADPTAAAKPSCTNDGPIGILNDGVYLFNALDADDRDAGATEIQDQWQGHPQSGGMYHHHSVPTYMLKVASAKNSSTLIGYALDGYGIYIERDANGNLLTNANLDSCHGRTSEVMWNGKMTDIYHYDATLEYPYTIGCFHGTPIQVSSNNGSVPSSKPGARLNQPAN